MSAATATKTDNRRTKTQGGKIMFGIQQSVDNGPWVWSYFRDAIHCRKFSLADARKKAEELKRVNDEIGSCVRFRIVDAD